MRKFNSSFPGYNKNEVNSFVNNVTIEYESMLNRLKSADSEIETLKKQLEHYKNIESTLNRAILIAEESSQNIKKTAFDESKIIIEEAKKYWIWIALINHNMYNKKHNFNEWHNNGILEYMYPWKYNKSTDYFYAKDDRRNDLCSFEDIDKINSMIWKWYNTKK